MPLEHVNFILRSSHSELLTLPSVEMRRLPKTKQTIQNFCIMVRCLDGSALNMAFRTIGDLTKGAVSSKKSLCGR